MANQGFPFLPIVSLKCSNPGWCILQAYGGQNALNLYLNFCWVEKRRKPKVMNNTILLFDRMWFLRNNNVLSSCSKLLEEVKLGLLSHLWYASECALQFIIITIAITCVLADCLKLLRFFEEEVKSSRPLLFANQALQMSFEMKIFSLVCSSCGMEEAIGVEGVVYFYSVFLNIINLQFH